MTAKLTTSEITALALRELEQVETIEDLKKTKGYVPAVEAHRRLGIGQRIWRSDRGSW